MNLCRMSRFSPWLVPGLLWLAKFTGYDKVLELGLYPFLWGDLLKAVLAAIAFPAAWSYLSSKR